MRKKGDSNTRAVEKTRRNFFRQFLSETICLVEEISGKPQMRLSDLDRVPDKAVREMIPVFNKSRSCRVKGDRLLMKNRTTGLFEEIFRLDSKEIYILHCFDGHHSLEDIARGLEDRFGQDGETAYQEVKSLFMILTKRFICSPAHAHNRSGNEASS